MTTPAVADGAARPAIWSATRVAKDDGCDDDADDDDDDGSDGSAAIEKTRIEQGPAQRAS